MSNKTNNRQAARLVYQFGEFCLDVDRGLLSRAGSVVPLRPKTWEVLAHLVKHHGELVSRADLIDHVWHNAVISDDSLTQCIVEIRRAIDDTDRTKLRTVPRRGFVFELPVTEMPYEEEALASRSAGSRRWLFAAAMPVLIVLGFLSLRMAPGPDETSSAAGQGSEPAVAVLAFADMTEAQDRQYFADGVAEEILNHLALIPELRVISRSSSFTFRGEEHDIAAIADSLDVDFVLEGSVRGAGDTLRITAQLIDTASDSHLWADSFDHDLSGMSAVDVQSDVAADVARAIGQHIGAPMSLPEHESLEVSPVAQDRYLRGMFYLRRIMTMKPSPDDYMLAAEHFEAAIEAAPDWAVPHAALGKTLHFTATGPYVAKGDVSRTFEESRRHLEEAVRLDPDHGPAYHSLAFVAHSYEFDFERAEALYSKAIALGGHPHWGYAIMLRTLGRYEEAVEQYRKRLLEDPLSVGVNMQLADSLRCIRRYAEAQERVDAMIEAHPQDLGFRGFQAYVIARQGKLDAARAMLDDYHNTEYAGAFAETYALLGMVEEAEARLDQFDEPHHHWMPGAYARIAVILGQEERALDYIEAVAEDQPRLMAMMLCPDDTGPLQDHPRFTAILARAGMPVTVAASR